MHNGFLFAPQRRFAIPTAMQSGLYEKIKCSDFLVADDKGMHRMVGLQYCNKTDYAPVITCICMRHEMAYAKQVACMLGKKMYYRSDFSARLCSYTKGSELHPAEYAEAVKLYREYLKAVETKKDAVSQTIRISKEGLKICGHVLKPFFKVKELIWLLGEPDERIWESPIIEVCSWNALGICSYEINHAGVSSVHICLKTVSGKHILPFRGDFYIDQKKFSGKKEDGMFNCYEIGRNAMHIGTKNEDCFYCDITDADFITIDFWKTIHFAVTFNQSQLLKKLIKKGHNSNYAAGYHKDPLLLLAVEYGFSDIVSMLIAAGADVNKANRWGTTPLMRAVEMKNHALAALLIKAGADTSKIQGCRPFP